MGRHPQLIEVPGRIRVPRPLGGRPRTGPDRVSGGTACVSRRGRRSFEQTVQLLEFFLHREGRASAARETIRVDGDIVKIGAWLAKARTKHRVGQLPEGRARLDAALFDGDWTTEAAVPAVLV